MDHSGTTRALKLGRIFCFPMLLSLFACNGNGSDDSEFQMTLPSNQEADPEQLEPGTGELQDETGAIQPVDTWTDPEQTKILELPPKWKAAGMRLELLNPQLAREQAPETFRVKFETTKGDITIECVRAWSPHGVDRFYNLVLINFFEDIAFHRVLDDFVVQFGIHGNPGISYAWNKAKILDEVPQQSNRRGYVTFAKANNRPNTRSTQLFINMADNAMLDDRGFSPIGRVVKGLQVVGRLYSGYGETVPAKKVRVEGNDFVREVYPKLDWLLRAEIIE